MLVMSMIYILSRTVKQNQAKPVQRGLLYNQRCFI